MSYSCVKGKIAVEPFNDTAVKTTAMGGGTVKVGMIVQKNELARLKVIFPSFELSGSYVHVPSEYYTQPYAKKIYEMDGQKFIIIPLNIVEIVEY